MLKGPGTEPHDHTRSEQSHEKSTSVCMPASSRKMNVICAHLNSLHYWSLNMSMYMYILCIYIHRVIMYTHVYIYINNYVFVFIYNIYIYTYSLLGQN